MAKAPQTALASWLERARHFLEELPEEGVSPRPLLRKLHTAWHFLVLVWQGLVSNRCPVRAAALSYTTLLALIPLLTVVVGISKNFLHDKSADVVPKLMDGVVAVIAPQLNYMPADGKADSTTSSLQAKQEAVAKIQSFIDNINSGTLTTVGSLFLVVVAIRLLMTIEQAFNDIWGVQQGRSIWRKVVYYWATITLGPLLLSVALYLTGRAEFLHALNRLQVVPGLEKAFLHFAPFVVLWVAFSLMYALMPNTEVRFHAAVAGGIVGGTLWQVNNLLNTLYVSRVVTYSKIYGTLGIIPVFLVGLYFSWLIVLFGAQISYAAQNIRAYLQQLASERIDQQRRELIACRVVLMACRNFAHGLKPPAVEKIAEHVGVSSQWLNHLVRRLTQGGLLSEVADSQTGLQPARPPESITLADVLHAVRTNGDSHGEHATGDSEQVGKLLSQLDAAQCESPANVKFSELVQTRGPATD